MKTKNILLTVVLFLSLGIFAQAPEKINYQAVARDLNGLALTGETVNLQFDIIQSSTTVYSETQTLTTNQFGLFTAQIGGGTVVSGNFSTIAWGSSPTSLQVTVNGDVMPSTQLLSVPYALYSKESANGPTGATGPAGIGINWLGTLTTVPATANLNDAYYNSTDGISYVFDGSIWQIVAQDGSASGLTAGTGIVISGGVISNVGDLDPINELQTLSLNGGSTPEINLSNGGNSVKFIGAGNTTLSTSSNEITINSIGGLDSVTTSGANISGDGTLGNPLIVTEGDPSTTNEIQTISASGGTSPQIDLSNTGGDVKFLGTGGTTLNQVGNAITINTATSSDNQNLINGGKTGNNQTLNIQNGTGITFSVADGDTSATNEIELPATAGVGDVLTFNAGSWGAQPIPAAPATFWTRSAGTLYPTTIADKVGIGVSFPTAQLEIVRGTLGSVEVFPASNTSYPLTINPLGTGGKYLRFTHASGPIMDFGSNGTSGWMGTSSNHNLFITANSALAMTVLTNGNVGIGTASPSEKLDVAGNTEVTGDYKYATIITRTLSIPISALNQKKNENSNPASYLVHESYVGGYYGESGYCYFKNGTLTVEGVATAPVYLPQDAVVTGLKVKWFDQSAAYNASLSLERINFGTINSSQMAVVSTTGSTTALTSMTTSSDATIASATIDNDNNAYYVKMSSQEGTALLGFAKIVITYTVTKAD